MENCVKSISLKVLLSISLTCFLNLKYLFSLLISVLYFNSLYFYKNPFVSKILLDYTVVDTRQCVSFHNLTNCMTTITLINT